ncbi:MAG: SAM-dependent methyltransferase [Alcanivoracaceae bacterium]|nr:SAM-dependent methyltransferase [Alcanivoracaceae bacterium]
MSGNSRSVLSPQTGTHPSLEAVVLRHLASQWRQPLADHNVEAFAALQSWRRQRGESRPLWLDSGCGTGYSSCQLARSNPDVLVIGIDQSAHRLLRGHARFELPANALVLRAECADIWRLMAAEGWVLQRNFLLYPNPWPKPGHLSRRWHGHPVLPTLLAISECLELRSNWPVYVEEMAAALALAGRPTPFEQFHPDQAISDFENKYQASGHALWRLTSCRI